MKPMNRAINRQICTICARSRCGHRSAKYEISNQVPNTERILGAYLYGITKKTEASQAAMAAMDAGHVEMTEVKNGYAVKQVTFDDYMYTWSKAPQQHLAFNFFIEKLERVSVYMQ